jgi:lysophospholipase L1-like esterase
MAGAPTSTAAGFTDDSQPGDGNQLLLARFCMALQQLQRGERAQPVRVLWLGDSHTFADFLPDAVRRQLQQQYGNGGPGFLHLGVKPYRHGSVKVEVTGSWSNEPDRPARSTATSDGVFGLGGIRSIPQSRDAQAVVELRSGAVSGWARWELLYRLPNQQASFQVSLDANPPRRIGASGSLSTQPQPVALEGVGEGRLRVSDFRGTPQLFGVIVESSNPGVVLDTLGINGARAATPLAWDQTAWGSAVAARAPDLLVVAYGTNEVIAAELPPERYAGHLVQVVQRVRTVQPGVDCLLLGPTDVAQADGTTHPRVVAIDVAGRRSAEQLRCAFFSPFRAMGGDGSMVRWMQQQPPLAAPDRVHLLAAGYRRLGEQIADHLLGACR